MLEASTIALFSEIRCVVWCWNCFWHQCTHVCEDDPQMVSNLNVRATAKFILRSCIRWWGCTDDPAKVCYANIIIHFRGKCGGKRLKRECYKHCSCLIVWLTVGMQMIVVVFCRGGGVGGGGGFILCSWAGSRVRSAVKLNVKMERRVRGNILTGTAPEIFTCLWHRLPRLQMWPSLFHSIASFLPNPPVLLWTLRNASPQ